ncbi:MlaC/ttg2D family ABC transporter substrate-binding protein [Aliikangiella sp. IMCC44359]|uniref:MlaC/ttg2D family ABC transporter substrate-binding protein n=1 Tax=Aliikangiella sp. IMCC44359 TaxID=3459125 RepID=UPI00403AB6E4
MKVKYSEFLVLKRIPVFLGLAFCCFIFPSSLLAFTKPSSLDNTAHSQKFVEAYYRQVITSLNNQMRENQAELSQSPEKLAKFIDVELLPRWSASKTLKGLLGRTVWNELTEANFKDLVKGFNNTLQRYVQESFSLYDGQKIEFVRVELNERASKGLLTLKVIPHVMPSFNVSFRIYKENSHWFLYDALVQGASYIGLKKDSYRKLHDKQGINGVISLIEEKNKGYWPSSLSK